MGGRRLQPGARGPGGGAALRRRPSSPGPRTLRGRPPPRPGESRQAQSTGPVVPDLNMACGITWLTTIDLTAQSAMNPMALTWLST
eukprot:scaffold251896_cov13-Prasinocladus_malaysianus.AAC.1